MSKKKRTILGYSVVTDIDMPPRAGGSGRAPKYPFYEMAVGESFLVVDEPHKVVSAAGQAYRRYGKKFSTRTLPSGDVRCWRVA